MLLYLKYDWAIEMIGSPYGEARRLRYLMFICTNLMEVGESDQNFFIDYVLKEITKNNINLNLIKYKRNTGVIRTKAVLRNYISYCNWLDLLKREGSMIAPNSKTVYFSSITNNSSFNLTEREKVSLFINLLNNDEFYNFFKNIKNNSTPKDYLSLGYNEHYIETFLEWMIDFDILVPTSKKFGKYRISHKYLNLFYYPLLNDKNQIVINYLTKLLNIKIHDSKIIPEREIWNKFKISLYKTNRYTRSELDSKLFAAFPAIFDLQIGLIFDFNTYYPFIKLVHLVEEISHNNKILFTWDHLQNVGFIKLES